MLEYQVDCLHVHIHPTREGMGRAAARQAMTALEQVITARGAARLLLASAPSQRELLGYLTRAGLDWSRVTLFHMDEYVGLAADHPASFRRFQQEHVLRRIRPSVFHGLRGEAPDLAVECARYSALLAEAPLDVICLGIGENGHLAFNDPPVANFQDPALVKVVALDEVCRQQQVHDGCFATLDEVPRQALTLTIPALTGGHRLVCVVPGERKARAIRDTLQGPLATTCPASILRRHPAATLHLDTDSASLLPNSG